MASRRVLMHSLLALALIAACSEAPVATSGKTTAAPAPSAAPSASAQPPRAETIFREGDFVERDDNRDPFRSYASLFEQVDEPTDKPQRRVRLADFSLDQLKLIAVVRNANPSVAMVTDPSGTGHVIRQGEYIGRAESVRAGAGGVVYDVNWRVDRIREADVVFVRQDPANPDTPAATRVLPLRDESARLDNLADGDSDAAGPSQESLDALARASSKQADKPTQEEVLKRFAEELRRTEGESKGK